MKRTLMLFLAALALIAAGCGGNDAQDKKAYVKDVKQAGQTLEKELTDLGSSISGSKDPKAIGTKLEESAGALDDAAKDLDDIDAPDDAKDAHSKIVDGVKDIADDFRTAATAAKAGDLQKLTSTLTGVQTGDGAKNIQEAQAELKKKGYKIEDS